MYLLARFGSHRSFGNGDINSYINSYMNNLGKAELIPSVSNIQRFLKSGIPIYNSEDTGGRKGKRRRPQATAKRFGFRANAIIKSFRVKLALQGQIT